MVELGESEAVSETDAKPSFDVDKPPPTSVADAPQPDRCSSPPLVADNSVKPGHAMSSGAAASSAETTSSTPSDAIRRHSLSPSVATSSSQTQMPERDEDKPELQSTTLSGIMHSLCCYSLQLYLPGNLPGVVPPSHHVGGVLRSTLHNKAEDQMVKRNDP